MSGDTETNEKARRIAEELRSTVGAEAGVDLLHSFQGVLLAMKEAAELKIKLAEANAQVEKLDPQLEKEGSFEDLEKSLIARGRQLGYTEELCDSIRQLNGKVKEVASQVKIAKSLKEAKSQEEANSQMEEATSQEEANSQVEEVTSQVEGPGGKKKKTLVRHCLFSYVYFLFLSMNFIF